MVEPAPTVPPLAGRMFCRKPFSVLHVSEVDGKVAGFGLCLALVILLAMMASGPQLAVASSIQKVFFLSPMVTLTRQPCLLSVLVAVRTTLRSIVLSAPAWT